MATIKDNVHIANPIPLPIGDNFQTARGPSCENWPSATSIKYIGLPTKTNKITYGMRKAPPPFS